MYSAITCKLHPLLRSRLNVLCVVAALTLIVAAAALAAHPKAGSKYSGFSSAAKVNSFRAPVSFKVSSGGTRLLVFKYGDVGCIPGGTITGNPYNSASGVIKVGTIAVSGTGSFSVKKAKSTYVNSTAGTTDVTKSTVTGKFKTAKTATGTITFTQHMTGPGGFAKSCGPIHLTFKATTK